MASVALRSMAELTSEDFYHDISCHLSSQEDRLHDSARVEAYRAAILGNKQLFKDKVVLDIGCGLGILSLLAAKAGASKVFAIEVPGMAELTEKVVKRNTSRIQVIQGRVGEVNLPVPEVDVIISDWMGPGLMQDSLLAAVLQARDQWLVQGGLLFPDRATLYMSATSDRVGERMEWWRNVYGFDMSSIERDSRGVAQLERVDSSCLVTGHCLLAEFTLQTCNRSQLTLTHPWVIKALKRDYIGGLVLYWKVHFSHGASPTIYSTQPVQKVSRPNIGKAAKQLVFCLEEPLTVRKGEELQGCIHIDPCWDRYRSQLKVEIKTRFDGKLCKELQGKKYIIL